MTTATTILVLVAALAVFAGYLRLDRAWHRAVAAGEVGQ